ncbi:hypothetical protein [Oceanobacillus oncorhynchi]|uniref:hypothetical protein n=1 Tax=Oceanobacillus oncorhynchi TaxID=545501 RepID=UPI0034D41A86
MIILWIIIAIALISIIYALISSGNESGNPFIKRNNNKDRLHQFLQEEYPQITKFFLHYDSGKGIALDSESKELCFLSLKDNKEINIKKRPFSSLLESEIIEDGVTVTKTSRGSQLAGSAVGGVLAGGAGAIIGGLSGQRQGTEEVSSVGLKLLFNDMDNPVEIVRFFAPLAQKSVSKSDQDYKNAFEEITNWHGTMKVIIENN